MKKMKRATRIFSAAALTLAMAGPVFAQPYMRPAAANADTSYFDSHPDVAHRLAKDPTLIDNQQFVDSHPGLHEYLHDHPGVRHDFRSHPYRFMHREEVYHKHHG
jgi:hypothetical protein